MTDLQIPQWLPASALLIGFGFVLLIGLRRAGSSTFAASVLIAVTFAQPAFLSVRTSAGATLFAAAVSAVAAATVSFVREQNARRIVLLGGSLAGAQLVNPIWGATATVVLPWALRRRLSSTSAAGLTGLYISILFVPVLTAAALFTFYAPVRSELWSIAFPNLRSAAIALSVLASILPGVPLLVALVLLSSDEAASQIAVIALAVLTVSTLPALVGIKSAPAGAAALGTLALVLVGTWGRSGANLRRAFLLAGASSAAAWVSMFVAQGHV